MCKNVTFQKLLGADVVIYFAVKIMDFHNIQPFESF